MSWKFGAPHVYSTDNGDSLYIRVTEFEVVGALDTDEMFFLLEFEVLGFTTNEGVDIEGSYPNMTDSLSDAIKDHIGPEHYTVCVGPDDEW